VVCRIISSANTGCNLNSEHGSYTYTDVRKSLKRVGFVIARYLSLAQKQVRQASLAFGPQHPAAHGILKLQLYLTGDTIR